MFMVIDAKFVSIFLKKTKKEIYVLSLKKENP